jgi:hypothetical protein
MPQVGMHHPGIIAERRNFAPVVCSCNEPGDYSERCGHAKWSIRWSDGGVLTSELKLCDEHATSLLEQLKEAIE